jgi:hypothetical protein
MVQALLGSGVLAEAESEETVRGENFTSSFNFKAAAGGAADSATDSAASVGE